VDFLEEKHLLHSLSIAKQFTFSTDQSIIDVGTGGGFPGIPLAIYFPNTSFTLVDSIGKKIRVVSEIKDHLQLENVTVLHSRMESLDLQCDYVISRAVTAFPQLFRWSFGLISNNPDQVGENGLISLKGGDLEEELGSFAKRVRQIPISTWFEEPFFYQKKIVYLKK
jgi:16S rRNA (guanine527-N7)-methyltransferase